MAGAEHLYLGFDLSTQQLKALVVRSDLKLAHEAKVDFDADFGQKYGVRKGVLHNASENEIFAPVALWLEALDLVLTRLKASGCDFGRLRGVCGSGMQHGTVFWSENAEALLAGLDGHGDAAGLKEQLAGKGAFAHEFSPNWQDASTQVQCEAFDKHLGGPQKLAEVTGSKAHHRFSGPQILRYRTKNPEHYARTARISLVSSFVSSVLLGKVAPMDISDVCGANLWDIKAGAWSEPLLELCAGGKDGVAGLKKKLGDVDEDGGKRFGPVSDYFIARYGFNKSCQVITATGDNPSTILSLPLREGDAIVSLGTSTTFLMSTPNYIPDPAYHFMNHPTTKGLYMFMLCYKNGGLAREHIRDALNNQLPTSPPHTWDKFNAAALASPPLNQTSKNDAMHLGLYFPLPEIVPPVPAGTWRYTYTPSLSPSLTPHPSWSADTDARAILESQFLSLRLRSRGLVTPQTGADGATLPPQPRRLYLVGGGSSNPALARICAEVLGSADGIFRLDIGGNACALGAAYKAAWGCERTEGEGFEGFVGARWEEERFVRRVCGGYRNGVWEAYGSALAGFEMMEKEVVEKMGKGLM